MDYETWRPALIAYYREEGWLQSAENIERGYTLTPEYLRTIRALAAAYSKAPREPMREAA